MLVLFPQATMREEIGEGPQTASVSHYCIYRFVYSNECLVRYEKKVTLCILTAPLAACLGIPIFPNPERFLQEKEGKKKRPFTNTLGLTAKSVCLPNDTQKYRRKLNRQNQVENLAGVRKIKYVTKVGIS